MSKDTTTMTEHNHAGPTRRLGLLAGVAVTLLLGGCVSFSQDGGLSVAQTVAYTDLNKDVTKITNEGEAFAADSDSIRTGIPI
jgi:outer membrane murein-binding lipoprotein Lpp